MEVIMETDDILTVEQVAKILALHPRTVRNKIERGIIPAHRLPDSRRLYIRRSDLLAALELVEPTEEDNDERL